LQHWGHSHFAGDFRVQKSVAKGHYFATIIATLGSDVMNIGYAQVSTLDQNQDLQMQAFRKAGCQKIFREKVSGASRSFSACSISSARDTVIMWKLDRLPLDPRSAGDNGNHTGGWRPFQSLSEPWTNTRTHAGKLMMTVFGGSASLNAS
jgi:hypothetical protein